MEDDLLESLSSLSSSLSSAPSDLEELHADEVNSKQKLSAYTPQSSSDDTAKVLESFIEHLPFDGKRIITKFVASCEDQTTLFELSTHLCRAILIPIMHIFHHILQIVSFLVSIVTSLISQSHSESRRWKNPLSNPIAI